MKKLFQQMKAGLFVFSLFFFSGCYHETYPQTATIREVDFDGFKFEISISSRFYTLLPGHPAGSGQQTIWIYTRRRVGRMSPLEILVSSTPAVNDHPLGRRVGQKGLIQLTDERLVIELESGIYNDRGIIDKYVPAPYSGTYKLISETRRANQ